jgi:hypothetical protein
MLEEARSTARLDLANILLQGIHDPTGSCVHRCGWSSKYAYAYLNSLQRQDLWPADLGRQSIARAITKAEAISDPIPEERSDSCTYAYKHCAPAYRKNRQWDLAHLDSRVGLCLHCIRPRNGNEFHCQLPHQTRSHDRVFDIGGLV